MFVQQEENWLERAIKLEKQGIKTKAFAKLTIAPKNPCSKKGKWSPGFKDNFYKTIQAILEQTTAIQTTIDKATEKLDECEQKFEICHEILRNAHQEPRISKLKWSPTHQLQDDFE